MIYGANAKVFLKYRGDIYELGKKLSKALITDLNITPRETEPFELVGTGEVLGFELFLNRTMLVEDYDYVFEIETEISYDELSLGQMYDLSLWLARYIFRLCDINTCAYDKDKNLIFFNPQSSP